MGDSEDTNVSIMGGQSQGPKRQLMSAELRAELSSQPTGF